MFHMPPDLRSIFRAPPGVEPSVKEEIIDKKTLHQLIPWVWLLLDLELCRKELQEHLKRQMEENCVARKLLLLKDVSHMPACSVSRRAAKDLTQQMKGRLQRGKQKGYRPDLDCASTATSFVHKSEDFPSSWLSCSVSVWCVQLMEQSWRDGALTCSREALKEQELPGLNPISWSGVMEKL